MTPISAVIITRNEADNIARCLRSLAGIADECLVLDSQSEDDTVAQAEALGARVISVSWQGYAATKNQGHRETRYPYILSLDADEALSPALQSSLRAAKTAGLQGAYQVNRLNYYEGRPIRHGGFYPDRKIRLFHREEARWEGAYVHETLQVKAGVALHHLPGDLLHYSYAHLAAQRLQGRPGLFCKMWLSPAWRFLQTYFLRGGFLDGAAGFHLCRLTAKEVFLKYRWARQGRNS
jgi:hypothetical protein